MFIFILHLWGHKHIMISAYQVVTIKQFFKFEKNCLHLKTHKHTHRNTHTQIDTHKNTHVHTHIHSHPHILWHTHTNSHTYTNTSTNVCTQTHHTDIHADTQISPQSYLFLPYICIEINTGSSFPKGIISTFLPINM